MLRERNGIHIDTEKCPPEWECRFHFIGTVGPGIDPGSCAAEQFVCQNYKSLGKIYLSHWYLSDSLFPHMLCMKLAGEIFQSAVKFITFNN